MMTGGNWRRKYAVASGRVDSHPTYFRKLDSALRTFAYFNESAHCDPILYVWDSFRQSWLVILPRIVP